MNAVKFINLLKNYKTKLSYLLFGNVITTFLNKHIFFYSRLIIKTKTVQ